MNAPPDSAVWIAWRLLRLCEQLANPELACNQAKELMTKLEALRSELQELNS